MYIKHLTLSGNETEMADGKVRLGTFAPRKNNLSTS